MNRVETDLTPELAAVLLAKAYPRQRRTARMTVESYTRAIKEGRWRRNEADAILVDPDGRMFNGGHRCAAVIAAHLSIPVIIVWGADPTTFDILDIGRKRSAYQFISETEASARASAARVTMWYERRFDRPLQPRQLGFDLHEILAEVERRSAAFDATLPGARTTYEYTSVPVSVALSAYAIAFDMGYQEQIEAFVNGIADPAYLPPGDPCRLLTERFRKESHRGRRRQLVEDWTILVRAFNLHLEGKLTGRLVLSEFWPRVAETEVEFNRRRQAYSDTRRLHDDGARHGVKRGTG